MGDERKDQNLPARPSSSLMGQLVRQRQAQEVVPVQQQNTGVAGAGQATGVGGARGTAPPPGASGVARPATPNTGVAGGRPASNVPATEGPSVLTSSVSMPKTKVAVMALAHQKHQANPGDLGAKFSANQHLSVNAKN